MERMKRAVIWVLLLFSVFSPGLVRAWTHEPHRVIGGLSRISGLPVEDREIYRECRERRVIYDQLVKPDVVRDHAFILLRLGYAISHQKDSEERAGNAHKNAARKYAESRQSYVEARQKRDQQLELGALKGCCDAISQLSEATHYLQDSADPTKELGPCRQLISREISKYVTVNLSPDSYKWMKLRIERDMSKGEIDAIQGGTREIAEHLKKKRLYFAEKINGLFDKYGEPAALCQMKNLNDGEKEKLIEGHIHSELAVGLVDQMMKVFGIMWAAQDRSLELFVVKAKEDGFKDEGIISGSQDKNREKDGSKSQLADQSGFQDEGLADRPRDTEEKDVQEEPVDRVSPCYQRLAASEKSLEKTLGALPSGPVERSSKRYQESGKAFLKAVESFHGALECFVHSSSRRGLPSEFKIIENCRQLVDKGVDQLMKAGNFHMDDSIKKKSELATLFKEMMADTKSRIEEAVKATLQGQGIEAVMKPEGAKEVSETAITKFEKDLKNYQADLAWKLILVGEIPSLKKVAKDLRIMTGKNVRELVDALKELPKDTLGYHASRYLAEANWKVVGKPLGQTLSVVHTVKELKRETVRSAFRSGIDRIIRNKAAQIAVRLSSNEMVVMLAGNAIYNVALEVIWPKLREEFRPKGNIERRIEVSTGTLREAMNRLNSLGFGENHKKVDFRLSVVKETCNQVMGIHHATRYLVKDIEKTLNKDQRDAATKYLANLESIPYSRWEPEAASKLGPPTGDNEFGVKKEAYAQNMETLKSYKSDPGFINIIKYFVTMKQLERTINRTRMRFMLDREEDFEAAGKILKGLDYHIFVIRRALEVEEDERIFFAVAPTMAEKTSLTGEKIGNPPTFYNQTIVFSRVYYFNPIAKATPQSGSMRETKVSLLEDTSTTTVNPFQSAKVYERAHLLELDCAGMKRFHYIKPVLESGRHWIIWGRNELPLPDGQHPVTVTMYSEEGIQERFQYHLIVQRDRNKARQDLARCKNDIQYNLNSLRTARDPKVRNGIGSSLRRDYLNLLYSLQSLGVLDVQQKWQALREALRYEPMAIESYRGGTNRAYAQKQIDGMIFDSMWAFELIEEQGAYGEAKKYFMQRRNIASLPRQIMIIGELANMATTLGMFQEARSMVDNGVSLASGLTPEDRKWLSNSAHAGNIVNPVTGDRGPVDYR